MDRKNSTNIPVVLITGFGPFRSIMVNPSWEIAKALKMYLEWTTPVHLIIEQIPVIYDEVCHRIPDYWLKYNPTLVVHLGVYAEADGLLLESHACNVNYCHVDNRGLCPNNGRCVDNDAPADLSTLLPIEDVCARVQRRTKIPVKISNDAGRFLCEFIYYQSLFIDRKRTVFIHVPSTDDHLFTVENLARAIQLIIYELLRSVEPLARVTSNENALAEFVSSA